MCDFCIPVSVPGPVRHAVLLTSLEATLPSHILYSKQIAPITYSKSTLTGHPQLVENTAILTPLECALTRLSPVTILDATLTKNGGVGPVGSDFPPHDPGSQSGPNYANKSFHSNLFAHPHPRTPAVSILYKNSGGMGCRRIEGSTHPLSLSRLSSQQILEVAHLIPEQVQLPRQPLNLGLRAAVDGEVQLAAHAILHVLTVLAHHDDRRLNRREQRQNEIQQDKWIRVPGRPAQPHVNRRVDAAQNDETNNKGPRPTEQHHGVRDALGQRRFLFDYFVRVARGTQPHELLRRVVLPPQHRQHIHSRVRLALQQRRDVSAADFDAHRILNGGRAGLMRRLLQHRGKTKKFAMRRLIHHHFLLIFVNRGHAHFSRDHHVGLTARRTPLVNALPRREILQLHLRRQHRGFIFVKQRKQRNVFQHFWIAGHRPPLPQNLDWFSVSNRLLRPHSPPPAPLLTLLIC